MRPTHITHAIELMLEAIDFYPLLQSHRTAIRLAVAELEALYPLEQPQDAAIDTAPCEVEP